MKILIEPPTWLGDAVMATPAIEALLEAYPRAEVTLVGSLLSTEALKFHPQVVHSEVLDKGWWALRRKAKTLGHFDLAFSFRSSARSAWFLFFLDAEKKETMRSAQNSERKMPNQNAPIFLLCVA